MFQHLAKVPAYRNVKSVDDALDPKIRGIGVGRGEIACGEVLPMLFPGEKMQLS
jgi:hypothetical protein